MLSQNTVLVDPQLRDMLAEVGGRLPLDLLASIRTAPGHSLAAVSDYGGTEASLRYETYVTYLVDINSAWQVTDPLDEFKKQNRIGERSMVFKGRNDGMKAPHYGSWIRAFSAMPGLCIAICWDKQITNYGPSEPFKKKFKEDLAAHGIPIKPAVALRMIKKISWLAVIGHLLQPSDKLIWISDNDEILEGRTKSVTHEAFNALANMLIPTPMAAMGYCKPLADEHETLLTLPDLIAGSLAASLPYPLNAGRLAFGDDVSRDIVHALADFEDAHNANAARCRLLTVVFVAEGDQVFLRTLQLSRGS